MASPPHIPQLTHPRKRGSVSSLSGAPSKKRKPSNLRNAFSPDAESVGSPRFSRSPSLDSVATTSVANGAGGGKKRRKKGDAGDGGSVAGSSGRGGKGRSVAGAEGEGAEAEYDEGEGDDDDDDDDLGDDMDTAIEGGMTVEARRKQEKDHERYRRPSPLQPPPHN